MTLPLRFQPICRQSRVMESTDGRMITRAWHISDTRALRQKRRCNFGRWASRPARLAGDVTAALAAARRGQRLAGAAAVDAHGLRRADQVHDCLRPHCLPRPAARCRACSHGGAGRLPDSAQLLFGSGPMRRWRPPDTAGRGGCMRGRPTLPYPLAHGWPGARAAAPPGP
jgi:hypothetical protein